MRIVSLPLILLACHLQAQEEIIYPIEAFKKLDTFEAHVLNKCDRVFSKREYRLAAKSYDSFVVEFPKSKAIPYALLRKARCLHMDNKRYKAISEYQELLDYFPDDVHFAAAAQYYIGACHHKNGDLHKALKTWASMMEDVEYRQHHLAAPAISILAYNMLKQEKYDMAVKYYRMVPENFRNKTNSTVMGNSINPVVYHYVRRKPDEPKLRDFYSKARAFSTTSARSPMPKDLEDDRAYWTAVVAKVKVYSSFNQFQKKERSYYYGYWSKKMAGKFMDSDGFQLDQAWFAWQSHQKVSQWYTSVDQIYARNPRKEALNNRVIRWLEIYAGHAAKIADYFKKIDWTKMNNQSTYNLLCVLSEVGARKLAKDSVYPRFNFEQMSNRDLFNLMKAIYEKVKDSAMAANLFGKFRLNEMKASMKVEVASYLWSRDENLVLRLYASLKDQDYANYWRLKYFHYRGDARRGIPMGKKVVNLPEYAKEAWLLMADLYEGTRNWPSAIQALRQADNPPDTLFRIATNYVRMGKLANAIAQLKEIENFFENVAPKAALTIAQIYQAAGKKVEEVGALRGVMKKYPKSGESNTAHERLEALGIKIGGGVDAD